MKYNLYLDDIRFPEDDSKKWVIARSFDDALYYLVNFGFPQEVSLDHDLGKELSGLDFAKQLVEEDLNNNTMPKDFKYRCHSANSVGRNNILGLLDNYMKERD